MDIFPFRLIHQYPAWFLILALLAGLLYAALLYYRNRREGFSPWQLWLLGLLRFLAVGFLVVLLLGPMIERRQRLIEDPLLIVLQDNSASLVAVPEDVFDAEQHRSGLNAFLREMQTDFDVRPFLFGERLREKDSLDFSDQLTDIARAFRETDALFSNRNIGAVVLLSDGIFNRGANPVFLAPSVPYPVYTMALGDTIPRKDLILKRVNYNRVTYLDNIFPVEVQIEARESRGLESQLKLYHESELIFSEPLSFGTRHDIFSVRFEVEASRAGMQRYRAEIAAIDGELSYANNIVDFYVEVIDSRQQILILAASPHPDVSAIKAALDAHDNFEVSVSLWRDFEGNPEAYNLIIMHQLPFEGQPSGGFFSRLDQADIPVLYVLGQQTDMQAFNRRQSGLDIQIRSAEFTESFASLNREFALFGLPGAMTEVYAAWPPLFAPFARYDFSPSLHVLFNQRVGQLVTEQPLIAFSHIAGKKTGIIAGEGLWRWRLQSFMRQGNHQAFDEMMGRMIQYLSLSEDKSFFRLEAPRFLFENEDAVFRAELYNQTYELVNEPEVRLRVYNEDGLSLEWVMGRTTNAYQLNAGAFAVGEYSWIAETSLGGESFTAEGRFSISPLNLEGLRTHADHGLLYQLADATGAEMLPSGDWSGMRERIQARDDIHSLLYSGRQIDDLMHFRWVFFFLLFLLGIEWFIRKRSGSY